MQESDFMEVLFGSDASVQGHVAVSSAHVDEVCVNCHPKFEFLNSIQLLNMRYFGLFQISSFILFILYKIEARELHMILHSLDRVLLMTRQSTRY